MTTFNITQLANKHYLSGGTLKVEDFADIYSTSVEEVLRALARLGFLQKGSRGNWEASPQARRVSALSHRNWSARIRTALDTELGPRVDGLNIITGGPGFLANRARRLEKDRQDAAASLRLSQDIQSTLASSHEHELCKLTGLARAQSMIAARTRVLNAQAGADEWGQQLQDMEAQAFAIAREHSADGDYPAFESELVDRVVFTADELTVAAIRFERSGKATPAKQPVRA